MQYDVNTPEEYLEALEEDWRKEKLLEIRKIIFDYAPNIDESIRYKMLNYGLNENENFIFALNAQKHYVSFYVGDIEKIDPTGDMLEAFNLGKGCIRVRKTINISETKLEAFIQQALELWRQGADVNC